MMANADFRPLALKLLAPARISGARLWRDKFLRNSTAACRRLTCRAWRVAGAVEREASDRRRMVRRSIPALGFCRRAPPAYGKRRQSEKTFLAGGFSENKPQR